MVRILLTGGAGFIGSSLCDQLIKKNYFVYVLDNLSTGKIINIPKHKNVKFINVDVNNKNKLINKTKNLKIDYIFHFGEYSRVEQSLDEPYLALSNIYKSFAPLLEFWSSSGAKLIYSGSSTKFASYQDDEKPSPYAWIKEKNTEHLINYSSWFGLEYGIVYFYNVYGGNEVDEGQFATVIGKFKKLILDGAVSLPVVEPGDQLRNFTHYSDIVSGLVTVALKGFGDGYGIGADRSVSMKDIVNFLGSTPHYIPPRRGNRVNADLVTSATRKLGWTPKVDIKEHLKDFIDGM